MKGNFYIFIPLMALFEQGAPHFYVGLGKLCSWNLVLEDIPKRGSLVIVQLALSMGRECGQFT